MDTTITILKENAPMATMLLLAGLLLQNNLGGNVQALRAEMVAGFESIRADMAADHQAIRAGMAAGDQAIRTGMAAGDQAIRTDIAAVRAELAEEFKSVRSEIAETNERLARVETRLDSIEDRLYMDTARAPM